MDESDFSDERPTSDPDESLTAERFGEFECFGRSYLFRFVEGRAPQAHVGIGSETTFRREEALRVLDSITVER